MPDPASVLYPTRDRQLERIRQTVLELGRVAYADTTAKSDWPGEVYVFLGRAGAILDIPYDQYQP